MIGQDRKSKRILQREDGVGRGRRIVSGQVIENDCKFWTGRRRTRIARRRGHRFRGAMAVKQRIVRGFDLAAPREAEGARKQAQADNDPRWMPRSRNRRLHERIRPLSLPVRASLEARLLYGERGHRAKAVWGERADLSKSSARRKLLRHRNHRLGLP